MSSAGGPLGAGMAADIAEQPDMYARLAQQRGPGRPEVAREIAARGRAT